MVPVSRSQATLLGLAAGNVLGLGWEGRPRSALAAQPLVPPRREARLPPDDDLAMALVLGCHLAAHPGGIDPRVLLAEYVEWMLTNGRGMGGLTREVLDLARRGADEPAHQVWRRRGGREGTVLGNGSVMRCAPLALRYRTDLERAAHEARTDSALTHWDARCCWASAATVLVIAHHLNEARDAVAETAAFLEIQGLDAEVRKALTDEAVGADFPEKAVLDSFDAGCCLVALRVACWASRWATDFERSLTRVLKAGGDTDTNGAIAGAVLGARFPESIPNEWLACVPVRNEIETLAGRLEGLA